MDETLAAEELAPRPLRPLPHYNRGRLLQHLALEHHRDDPARDRRHHARARPLRRTHLPPNPQPGLTSSPTPASWKKLLPRRLDRISPASSTAILIMAYVIANHGTSAQNKYFLPAIAAAKTRWPRADPRRATTSIDSHHRRPPRQRLHPERLECRSPTPATTADARRGHREPMPTPTRLRRHQLVRGLRIRRGPTVSRSVWTSSATKAASACEVAASGASRCPPQLSSATAPQAVDRRG